MPHWRGRGELPVSGHVGPPVLPARTLCTFLTSPRHRGRVAGWSPRPAPATRAPRPPGVRPGPPPDGLTCPRLPCPVVEAEARPCPGGSAGKEGAHARGHPQDAARGAGGTGPRPADGRRAREAAITPNACDRWRKEHGGLGVGQAKRLEVLQRESARRVQGAGTHTELVSDAAPRPPRRGPGRDVRLRLTISRAAAPSAQAD